MNKEPNGFEKFEARRGGRWETFDLPMLHVSRWGIYINREAVKEIGKEYKYAVLYFDKNRGNIGVWFWKEPVVGSYGLVSNKYRDAWHITAGSFLKKYGILEKVKTTGKVYFPFKRDEGNEEFYVAEIR